MKRSVLTLLTFVLLCSIRLCAQTTCLTANIAAGKTVKASYLQSEAPNLVDGNMTTIWQPDVNGSQWVYIDLGQGYTVCKTILKWDTWNSFNNFTVQISSDTINWTTIATVTNNYGTVMADQSYTYHSLDLSANTTSARYIRYNFPSMVAWNSHLDEIEVYNSVPVNLPVVSLTAPADGSNYIEGDSIVFHATATETSGTISKVEFYQGSTKIGEDATSPYSYTWTKVPEGEYTITAKAIDVNGYSSASTYITVYVDFPSPSHWIQTGTTTYDTLDNIGIGTTNTQGYKLAVNGSAIFTKVKVKPLSAWPDYVFHKTYALPDLSAVDKYIALHKHLPGVLSADELKKSGGVDIGENQALLLQKIEELTLYIIRQNRELEALKKKSLQLTDLQEQIDELKKLIQSKK